MQKQLSFVTVTEYLICLVVLQLQKRIKKQYENHDVKSADNRQIVIFGKNGHAEVLGLVGQTHSEAIVIEKFDDDFKISSTKSIDF